MCLLSLTITFGFFRLGATDFLVIGIDGALDVAIDEVLDEALDEALDSEEVDEQVP